MKRGPKGPRGFLALRDSEIVLTVDLIRAAHGCSVREAIRIYSLSSNTIALPSFVSDGFRISATIHHGPRMAFETSHRVYWRLKGRLRSVHRLYGTAT